MTIVVSTASDRNAGLDQLIELTVTNFVSDDEDDGVTACLATGFVPLLGVAGDNRIHAAPWDSELSPRLG